MPRLLRPHIPLETRCRVVLRQLGDMLASDTILWGKTAHGGLGQLLSDRLERLAYHLACEVADLHLDHDPALGAREKVFKKGEHVGYKPDANDPEHLFYREKLAHRIKTNIRGEHGQHPDRVLIKKQRRRERGPKPHFRSRVNKSKPKRKWAPGRKLQGRPFERSKR